MRSPLPRTTILSGRPRFPSEPSSFPPGICANCWRKRRATWRAVSNATGGSPSPILEQVANFHQEFHILWNRRRLSRLFVGFLHGEREQRVHGFDDEKKDDHRRDEKRKHCRNHGAEVEDPKRQ